MNIHFRYICSVSGEFSRLDIIPPFLEIIFPNLIVEINILITIWFEIQAYSLFEIRERNCESILYILMIKMKPMKVR